MDDLRDQYIGINLKQILYLPNFGILTVIKLMLMEARIIVYSQNSAKLSSFIYSIIGLFPGMLTFDFDKTLPILK